MAILAPDRARSSRGEAEISPGRTVVVAHDGSSAATEVLAHAAQRVGRGGYLVVVHALPPGETPAGYVDVVSSMLENIESALPLGVAYELRVVDGSASRALTDAAARNHADEIVAPQRLIPSERM